MDVAQVATTLLALFLFALGVAVLTWALLGGWRSPRDHLRRRRRR